MKDLSLHVLDIVQNSISAGATLIETAVKADEKLNTLSVRIADNGSGMEKEMLEKVTDPYTTSRTTRKVGLGLPLFRQNAETAGGTFSVESAPGVGTTVTAVFGLDNIDRPPLGDMAGVMAILIGSNPERDFTYAYTANEETNVIDTREVKAELDGIPISENEVLNFIRQLISQWTEQTVKY